MNQPQHEIGVIVEQDAVKDLIKPTIALAVILCFYCTQKSQTHKTYNLKFHLIFFTIFANLPPLASRGPYPAHPSSLRLCAYGLLSQLCSFVPQLCPAKDAPPDDDDDEVGINIPTSSSSSSGGASLAGHSCLHEFTPLGTVLRTLPRRVEAEIVLLEVELNRSKPSSSWSARWTTPVHRQTTDGCSQST